MVTFVATAHKETVDSYQFLSSLILQTDSRWKCIIYCDGRNEYIEKVVEVFNDDRISIFYSEEPKGFWGHYNRKYALDNLVDTEFVIQTSIQDYYLPITVGEILKLTSKYDFIMFNSLHNHISYKILDVEPIKCKIDWGMFAIKTSIAKQNGINNIENRYCDGVFVEECFRNFNLKSAKIHKILMIHN
jgi:hypothetical protein